MKLKIMKYNSFKIRGKSQLTIIMLSICFVLFSLPESFGDEHESSELWKTMSELPERRTSSAAITLNDNVYVIAGT